MTNARKISAPICAALLASLFLAGCSEEPSGTATPSASPSETTTSPPPSPSATTSESPSESEMAEQAAAQVVRDYFATVDRLRQDSKVPLAQLKTVAVSGYLASQEIFLAGERDRGLHQVGLTRVVDVKVESVNLENSDPKAGRVPTAVVDVCWDVSGADLVNGNGKSVLSESRRESGWTRYTVANYHWAKDPTGSWRVSSGQDLERTSCSAA